MPKLPYMPFYVADWTQDTRCLSPTGRGVWIDILCALWNSKTRGKRTLNLEGWAGQIGVPSAETSLYLYEIATKGVGTISRENDEEITIISRRMVRDERVRRCAAKRKRKQRDEEESRGQSRASHGDVTGIYQKSDIRYQKSEEEKMKKREEKKIPTLGSSQRQAKSASTWNLYSVAYKLRYGVMPVRNHKTNSLLCQLVDRLGEEAPEVAAFYLSHNGPLYVRSRHPPDLLIRDAEGLRTQWATGTKATTKEAQSAEQADNAREQLKRVAKLTETRHG